MYVHFMIIIYYHFELYKKRPHKWAYTRFLNNLVENNFLGINRYNIIDGKSYVNIFNLILSFLHLLWKRYSIISNVLIYLLSF